jgi:hypothetical protein
MMWRTHVRISGGGKERTQGRPSEVGIGRATSKEATVAKVFQGRYSADLEGDFVVFLIGMRINKPWDVRG